MSMEKDLFGGQILTIKGAAKKRPKNLFTDYDNFVDKFDAPKTTDDCYTPPDVYAAVVNYVAKHCDLTARQIVRPFWPGGDYEHAEYPEGCIVIDNPPFSIISKIARFYISKRIGFFLFAPHLTLFSAGLDCTHVVVGETLFTTTGRTSIPRSCLTFSGMCEFWATPNCCKPSRKYRRSTRCGCRCTNTPRTLPPFRLFRQ